MATPPPPAPKSTPPAPLAPKSALPKPPAQAVTKVSPVLQHTPKTFSIKPWASNHEGEKTMVYANNGFGKTTLAAMAPGAVFIGLDDGARKIKHPVTGKDLNAILGIQSFQDLRDALHQKDLIESGQTLVIDTVTEVDSLAAVHTCLNVKHEKGHAVTSLVDYGYGKGYDHLVDTMRIFISDLEPHVRRGVHILLLAQQSQATVANVSGIDYMQDGPMLTSQPKNGMNVRSLICGWCDHIFRIATMPVEVVKANPLASKGKATGTMDRVIYTAPEIHFVAKNRMNGKLAPAIGFASPTDNSLWHFMFGQTPNPQQ